MQEENTEQHRNEETIHGYLLLHFVWLQVNYYEREKVRLKMLDLKSSQVDLSMQRVILNLIRMGHEKKEKSYDKSILPF